MALLGCSYSHCRDKNKGSSEAQESAVTATLIPREQSHYLGSVVGRKKRKKCLQCEVHSDGYSINSMLGEEKPSTQSSTGGMPKILEGNILTFPQHRVRDYVKKKIGEGLVSGHLKICILYQFHNGMLPAWEL